VPALRVEAHKSMEKNEETHVARDNNKTLTVKTVEISVEAYNQLRSLQEALQKILRKKQVSFDQVIKVILNVGKANDVLMEYILEDAIRH
jgi:hypothetical protein